MGKPNGCNSCFYALKDSSEFPCNICKGYDYYLHKDVYKEETDNKAWAKVVEGLNGIAEEDMWPKFEGRVEGFNDYDTVNKPKHYMLFNQGDVTGYAYVGKGIEVRDVIEKLVDKLPPMPGMTVSDYVQMMQYLMRFMDKNGVEDLEKASWYLDKIIQSLKDLKDY